MSVFLSETMTKQLQTDFGEEYSPSARGFSEKNRLMHFDHCLEEKYL